MRTIKFVLPAHAGVILKMNTKEIKEISITRTCGGDPIGLYPIGNVSVYYPHMRGWSLPIVISKVIQEVLPAHAGVIPDYIELSFSKGCITRTCGGDPYGIGATRGWCLYYPHMRGWSSKS